MPNLEMEMEDLMEPLGETEDESENWEAEAEQYGGLEESEGFAEGEEESEEFLGALIRTAAPILKRAASGGLGGLLPNLAQQAAKVAGGAIAGPRGAALATQVARRCLRESEWEVEVGYESEALLEEENIDHEAFNEAEWYAERAAEAESSAEAEQFLGALIPVISQVAGPLLGGLLGGDGEQEQEEFIGDILGGLLGEEEAYGEGEEEGEQFLPALAALAPMVLPLIQKGVGAVGKLLSKNRSTRRAIRTLPSIAANTAKTLARTAASGKRVTQREVASTLARQTARTLGNRKRLSQTMRRNQKVARRVPPGSLIGPGGMRPRPRQGAPGVAPRTRSGVIGYIPVLAARRRRRRPPSPVYR